MSELKKSNHWASLADELGIDANTEATQNRQHDPSPAQLTHQPRSQATQTPRPKANWNDLASELGVVPSEERPSHDEEPRARASATEETRTEDVLTDDRVSFDEETGTTSSHEEDDSKSRKPDATSADDGHVDGGQDDGQGERKTARRRRRRGRGRGRKSSESQSDDAGGDKDVAPAVVEEVREDALSGATTEFVEQNPESEENNSGENEEQEGKPKRRRRRRRRRRKETSETTAEDASLPETLTDQAVAEISEESDNEELPIAAEEMPEAIDLDEIPLEGSQADGDETPSKKPHRNIPTWADALSALIERNLEARNRNPDPSASAAPGRGRGRRGRGRSSSKKK